MARPNRRLSDDEVVFTTRESSDAWQRAIARGEARRIGRGVVTTNRSATLAKVVRRNWSRIAAHFAPGATVVDRSFFDGGPASDGTIVLDVGPSGSRRTRPIEIPGLRIVTRVGPGPIAGDVPFTDGLHFSGQTRAYLDNLRPARARGGRRRTLPRHELEERLARMLTTSGEAALGHLRDEARSIAPLLDAEREAAELDRIIGSLFGTKDAPLHSRAGRAMRDGNAFDDRRIELFALLQQVLLAQPPVQRLARSSDDPELFAFYESYFSNYIEGTRFTVDEAKEIVFDGVVPSRRPDDAHDIRGTYELIYPPQDDTRQPRSSDELVELLQQRHAILLAGRPDKQPGEFKEANNQAGAAVFVDWKLVRGTFREGFRFYLGLPEGLSRAIFIMFFIAEVHPFADGNGRIARVFMNTELTADGQQRIIIPTGYRQNYLNALSGITHNSHAAGLIRMLDFAHRYSTAIDWSTHDRAERSLRATGAFDEDPAAARIRLPEPWD
jgi:hypothetical protein